MRTANIFISFIFLAFTGFYAFLIWKLPSRDLPNTLGAAFVPWVLAGFLLFLTLLLLFNNLLTKNEKNEVKSKYSLKELGGIAGLLVLIILYIKAMAYFGFIASSLVFLAVLTFIAGARRVWEIALFSILTTIAVYFLFHNFFKVMLPDGQVF